MDASYLDELSENEILSIYSEQINAFRSEVFQSYKAIAVNLKSSPPKEIRQVADSLFDQFIATAAAFKRSKVDDKRGYFRQLIYVAWKCIRRNCCIRVSRANARQTKTAAARGTKMSSI